MGMRVRCWYPPYNLTCIFSHTRCKTPAMAASMSRNCMNILMLENCFDQWGNNGCRNNGEAKAPYQSATFGFDITTPFAKSKHVGLTIATETFFATAANAERDACNTYPIVLLFVIIFPAMENWRLQIGRGEHGTRTVSFPTAPDERVRARGVCKEFIPMRRLVCRPIIASIRPRHIVIYADLPRHQRCGWNSSGEIKYGEKQCDDAYVTDSTKQVFEQSLRCNRIERRQKYSDDDEA